VVLGARSAAQDAPKLKEPSQASEPGQGGTDALSVRYRFQEKYTPKADPAHPELVSDYQVGVRETFKRAIEKSQGAPDRSESSSQMIYLEQTAKVSKTGGLDAAVRRYDRFHLRALDPTPIPKIPFFENLTVWIQIRPNGAPEVLSLTPGRPLREYEYRRMLDQVSFPPLTVLLPATPRRVGDSWSVPRQAARFLLGELPAADEYALSSTLMDVRKSAGGNKLTAVFGVSGQATLSDGPCAINAEMQFIFEPPAAVVPAPGAGETGGALEKGSARDSAKTKGKPVDALGWISEVRLAKSTASPLAEGEGRLRQTVTYELILARRPLSAVPNQAGGSQLAPVNVPDPAPTRSEANSWLLYEDSDGRFHFRHPQELQLSPRRIDPNFVELVDLRPEGTDVLNLEFPLGAEDPQGDRKFRDTTQFQRDVDARWTQHKEVEIVRGPVGWLQAAEWAPLKVYRVELAVKAGGTAPGGRHVERIYFDYYLVLTQRNQCAHLESITVRDDHVTFRNVVETVIRSLQFGPSEWQGTAKPASAKPRAPR
jgi:hypothetical protein